MCSDGIDVNFCETERRQTYKPQTSIVSEESIVSTIHSSLQQLVPVSSTFRFVYSADAIFRNDLIYLSVTTWSLYLNDFRYLLSVLSKYPKAVYDFGRNMWREKKTKWKRLKSEAVGPSTSFSFSSTRFVIHTQPKSFVIPSVCFLSCSHLKFQVQILLWSWSI